MPSGKNVCGYAESQSCLEEQIKEVISNNVMREVSTSGEVPPEGLIRKRNMSGQEGGSAATRRCREKGVQKYTILISQAVTALRGNS